MRRNSPLSTYTRGYVFFNWKDMATAPKKDRDTVEQNLKAMLHFDSLTFGQLVLMADSVYEERSLEDKLGNLMNRYETRAPVIKPNSGLDSRVQRAGPVEIISG